MQAIENAISGRTPKPQVRLLDCAAHRSDPGRCVFYPSLPASTQCGASKPEVADGASRKTAEGKPAAPQTRDAPPGSTDPLSFLTEPEAPKAGKQPPKNQNARQPEEKKKAVQAPKKSSAAPAGASTFASHFMTSCSVKSFPVTGDGLRDAIKAKDLAGVKRILQANPALANYEDSQKQSMLHLAAIFGHTEIAMALVGKGASPHLKNDQGETAMDVASPSLAEKIKAAASS